MNVCFPSFYRYICNICTWSCTFSFFPFSPFFPFFENRWHYTEFEGNYPVSLNDQSSSWQYQHKLVFLSCHYIVVFLLICWSSVSGWSLVILHDMSCVKAVRSSFSLPITPKGLCSFWAKGMHGTTACSSIHGWISFSRLTQRCREGQGEDRTMSLSHRYIKELAEVASLVGCALGAQNSFIWFCVWGGKTPDLASSVTEAAAPSEAVSGHRGSIQAE